MSSPFLDNVQRETYGQIIGSLQYAASGTRPDISTVVNLLSRVQKTPTQTHLSGAKRVLKYLKGTDTHGIHFPVHTTMGDDLVCHADADWATDKESRRSTTGWCVHYNGGLPRWRSRLQTSVALATGEAEYIALCDATKEVVYLHHLLGDMGFPQSSPTPIFEDNSACIRTTSTHFTTDCTKHIELEYHYTRSKVLDHSIQVLKVPTSRQLADLFNKLLPCPAFLSAVRRLLCPSSS